MLLSICYTALCAILVPIFRVRGIYGYTDAKNQLFLLLTILTVCIGLFTGGMPSIAGAPALLFFSFLILLSVSVLWSDNKENAINDLPRWWTLFFFFLFCGNTSKEILLPAVFITSVFAALYGLIQQFGPYKKLWFTYDPVWKDLDITLKTKAKLTRLYSWLGNSNYTTSYLVPCFFIGLYLTAIESRWYLIGLIPVWLAIGFGRSRAGWIATILGLGIIDAILNPWLLFIFIPAMAVIGLIASRRPESVMWRWFYIKICLRLWKRAPIFGHGPRVFRNKIFDVQSEINFEHPEYLGTPVKPGKNGIPIGKRAHNDHIETLAETGIAGYALFLAFCATVIMTSSNIFITGGLIAAIINAFFFYNLRTSATALPFFAMAGLSAGNHGFLIVSLPFTIGISALLLYLAYRLVWLPLMANFWYWDGSLIKEKDKAKEMLFKALYYFPNDNFFLDAASQVHLPEDPPNALLSLLKMVYHNDGQKLPWSTWFKIGQVAMINGSAFLARSAFAKAIQLNPAFGPAHEAIKHTQTIIAQIEEQIKKQEGRIILPNGKSGKMVQIVH